MLANDLDRLAPPGTVRLLAWHAALSRWAAAGLIADIILRIGWMYVATGLLELRFGEFAFALQVGAGAWSVLAAGALAWLIRSSPYSRESESVASARRVVRLAAMALPLYAIPCLALAAIPVISPPDGAKFSLVQVALQLAWLTSPAVIAIWIARVSVGGEQ